MCAFSCVYVVLMPYVVLCTTAVPVPIALCLSFCVRIWSLRKVSEKKTGRVNYCESSEHAFSILGKPRSVCATPSASRIVTPRHQPPPHPPNAQHLRQSHTGSCVVARDCAPASGAMRLTYTHMCMCLGFSLWKSVNFGAGGTNVWCGEWATLRQTQTNFLCKIFFYRFCGRLRFTKKEE